MIERGQETISTLPRIQPFWTLGTAHCEMSRGRRRIQEMVASGCGSFFTDLFGLVLRETSRAYNFTGLPARRQMFGRRFVAGLRPVFAGSGGSVAAILLSVAVTRIDFDEPLSPGIVISIFELFGES